MPAVAPIECPTLALAKAYQAAGKPARYNGVTYLPTRSRERKGAPMRVRGSDPDRKVARRSPSGIAKGWRGGSNHSGGTYLNRSVNQDGRKAR